MARDRSERAACRFVSTTHRRYRRVCQHLPGRPLRCIHRFESAFGLGAQLLGRCITFHASWFPSASATNIAMSAMPDLLTMIDAELLVVEAFQTKNVELHDGSTLERLMTLVWSNFVLPLSADYLPAGALPSVDAPADSSGYCSRATRLLPPPWPVVLLDLAGASSAQSGRGFQLPRRGDLGRGRPRLRRIGRRRSLGGTGCTRLVPGCRCLGRRSGFGRLRRNGLVWRFPRGRTGIGRGG